MTEREGNVDNDAVLLKSIIIKEANHAFTYQSEESWDTSTIHSLADMYVEEGCKVEFYISIDQAKQILKRTHYVRRIVEGAEQISRTKKHTTKSREDTYFYSVCFRLLELGFNLEELEKSDIKEIVKHTMGGWRIPRVRRLSTPFGSFSFRLCWICICG